MDVEMVADSHHHEEIEESMQTNDQPATTYDEQQLDGDVDVDVVDEVDEMEAADYDETETMEEDIQPSSTFQPEDMMTDPHMSPEGHPEVQEVPHYEEVIMASDLVVPSSGNDFTEQHSLEPATVGASTSSSPFVESVSAITSSSIPLTPVVVSSPSILLTSDPLPKTLEPISELSTGPSSLSDGIEVSEQTYVKEPLYIATETPTKSDSSDFVPLAKQVAHQETEAPPALEADDLLEIQIEVMESSNQLEDVEDGGEVNVQEFDEAAEEEEGEDDDGVSSSSSEEEPFIPTTVVFYPSSASTESSLAVRFPLFSTEGTHLEESSQTIILKDQHDLFHGSLYSFLQALKLEQPFNSLVEGKEVSRELLIEHEDMELTVGEDNSFALTFAIADFAKLHRACELAEPMVLHIKEGNLRFQERFAAIVAMKDGFDAGVVVEDGVHESFDETEEHGINGNPGKALEFFGSDEGEEGEGELYPQPEDLDTSHDGKDFGEGDEGDEDESAAADADTDETAAASDLPNANVVHLVQLFKSKSRTMNDPSSFGTGVVESGLGEVLVDVDGESENVEELNPGVDVPAEPDNENTSDHTIYDDEETEHQFDENETEESAFDTTGDDAKSPSSSKRSFGEVKLGDDGEDKEAATSDGNQEKKLRIS